jgi:hypothetical protein
LIDFRQAGQPVDVADVGDDARIADTNLNFEYLGNGFTQNFRTTRFVVV